MNYEVKIMMIIIIRFFFFFFFMCLDDLPIPIVIDAERERPLLIEDLYIMDIIGRAKSRGRSESSPRRSIS